MLDENVLMLAMAGGRVEYAGGRYERVDTDDQGALELVNAIEGNGRRIALSAELWRRYMSHRAMLWRSGVEVSPAPITIIEELLRRNRVAMEAEPPAAVLAGPFPEDDRYLAHLALATGAALVTEDGGVHEAAAGGNLGFDVLDIAGAIERARETA